MTFTCKAGDGEFDNENYGRPLLNHPFHTNLILHKVNKECLLQCQAQLTAVLVINLKMLIISIHTQ